MQTQGEQNVHSNLGFELRFKPDAQTWAGIVACLAFKKAEISIPVFRPVIALKLRLFLLISLVAVVHFILLMESVYTIWLHIAYGKKIDSLSCNY